MKRKEDINMKPTVLLYNFNDGDRNKQITLALMPLGFRLKKVGKEDYNQPLGYLAGLKEVSPVEGHYTGDELGGEMLIMVGMNSGQIDSLLQAFRKNGIPKVKCKAVLTSTNQHWNAIDLYDELKREHDTLNPKKPIVTEKEA